MLKKLFNTEYKQLKKFETIALDIEKSSDKVSKYSDEELANQTVIFREQLSNGATLDDIKVEALAVCREACFRVISQKPYHVQLLGGLAIHDGNIAQMKTGEGKTLTSVLPAYLNALEGNGVHVITVNEYLASRDSSWMGQIFKFLGLTVGLNLKGLTPNEKREAYNCDILYTTNNELGFDYLRDNMVIKKENRVQRPLNYCIIDEVDSVLIDEARTPLIISGGKMQNSNLYSSADKFAKSLSEDVDFIIDEKSRTIGLTEEGSKKCEKSFNIDNLYDINNTALVHHVNQALRANYFMKNDVDYVVEEDSVVIVDQFTGRLMKGRAFSEGLHQAIEAKEGVKIKEETKTLATITFQNLFRMYKKLSGMTGTAKTEEEEFRNIYNMYVLDIPTNKAVQRDDQADLIYGEKLGKYKSIVNEIEIRNKTKQPVLVGTIAIETSEIISQMLNKKGIKHEVLNAKNHEREADIITKAGEAGSVTIATNMAGRGTDIKLGDGVSELGGLCVLGTERHESRRIDDQLRGRSGRQGDVGFTQFYVSLEDDLMRRFGSDKLKGMLKTVGFEGEQSIKSKMFSKSVESAQRRVEGSNYDHRKQLLQYDDVMNQQRKIIYERRNNILDSDSIHDGVLENFKNYIDRLVNNHIAPEGYLTDKDNNEIVESVNENLVKDSKILVSDIEKKEIDEVIDIIYTNVLKDYETKTNDLTTDMVSEFEKVISLNILDTNWMNHISSMAHLKEGIGLRGYAQTNPLQAYTMEGFDLFDEMLNKQEHDIALYLLKSEIRHNLERRDVNKNQVTNDSSNSKPVSRVSSKEGRNSLCSCGSGKKHKQCCGKN